jgi:acyl-CoA synthetase (AMP-forming)/AMP-acid ligase II
MTSEHVAFHAAERPHAVAMMADGRAITYPELDRDIAAMCRAMRALGLARGDSVAVGHIDLYVHWLLLLASERLGIAAASFQGPGGREDLLAGVDLVLAEPTFSSAAVRRFQRVDADWVRAALARSETDDDPLPAPAPDDPVRIVGTSGTTGLSKRFVVLRKAHDIRAAQWVLIFSLTSASRYLVALPMLSRGNYDFGCGCLRAGGTVVLETRIPLVEALRSHAITHVITLPIHLKTIVDGLPPDFVRLPGLTVLVFGGRVSSELRRRTTERLANALYETYGTTEICTISTICRPDADGFGTIWPRVEVEVVDDRDQVLPHGTVGRVRARSELLCAGYLGEPEATAQMFRNGWFYPGDLAVLKPGRQLKVLGRSDDLLNIGGQKYLPNYLEELLMHADVASEVGVCSVESADGIEQLCIAVSQPRCDDAEIVKRVTKALRGYQTGTFAVIRLAQIPRTASGKIVRRHLKAEVASILATQSSKSR